MQSKINERWKIAQQGERQCWYYIRNKVNSKKYLQSKANYWHNVLEELPEVKITEDTKILDVGCGPSGILLAVDSGKRTGLDSLMNYYLDSFPYLHQMDVEWINGTIEDFYPSEKFNVIFMMNSLDHVKNPQLAVESAKRLLLEGGYLIVSLNCHNYTFLKRYFIKFNKYVDTYHPFQWDKKDVLNLLRDFEMIKIENVDDLVIRLQEQVTENNQKQPMLKSFLTTWYKLILNPLSIPIDFIGLLGIPRHKTSKHKRSIFSHYIFLAKKVSDRCMVAKK